MSSGGGVLGYPSTPFFCARARARARNRNRIYFFLAILTLLPPLLTACGPASSAIATNPSIQIIGRRGSAPGSFSHPRGIEVAPDGTLAVTDKTGRLQLFSPDGTHQREWLFPKIDNGTPTGLIYDYTSRSSPTLVVADTHLSRILRYDLQGNLLHQFGEYGDASGKMIYPTDVAFDRWGTLFIAEYGTHDRVMVFSGDGKFIRQFGKFGTRPGEFQRPMAIVYDPRRDGLIVADTCNHRLQIFNKEGDLICVWGGVGDAPGQFNYPYDLAVDDNGDIYVMEYGNNRLQVLDAEGNVKAVYGGPGAEPGQFAGPWGVALMPDHRVAVADTNNHRIQIIDKDLILASKPPEAAQVEYQRIGME